MSVEEVKKKLEEFESDFQSIVDTKIPISVDFAFTTSHGSKDYIYTYTTDHISYLLRSSLGPLCSKHEEYKKAVVARVQRFVFRYDISNSVNDDASSYRHYKIEITNGEFILTVNIEDYNSTCYSMDDKLAALFDVAAEIEVAEVKAQLEEFQDRFEAKVDKKIPVSIDFSFVDTEAFKSEKQESQVRLIKNITSSHLGYILTNSSSLGYLCEEDAIFKNAVSSRVNSVLFRYDVHNNVSDETGSYKFYKVEIDNGVFIVTMNLDEGNSSLYELQQKLDVLFDVRVDQAIEKLKPMLEQVEENFEQYLDKKIKLSVDYRFTKHDDFKSLSLNEQENAITYINDHFQYALTNSSSLGSMARESEIFKETAKNRIHACHFVYDMENNVCDDIGSYKHYKLEIEKGVFIITVNFQDARSSLYSVNEKLERLINVATAQGIAECNSEIEKLVERLESEIDMKVPITVPYSKFINSETWKEYNPNEEKRVFSNIYDSHIRYALFNSGLVSLANKSELWKEQILKKINHITFEYDPTDEVCAENESYNYYDVSLSKAGLLSIVLNLKENNSSLYNIEERLEKILGVGTMSLMEKMIASLEEARSELESATGKNIEIDADYTFIDDSFFIEKSNNDRGNIFEYFVSATVRYVLFNSGFVEYSEKNKSVLEKVKKIVFRYDVQNNISTGLSYDYYEFALSNNGVLVVSHNFDKYRDYAYYAGEALEKFFQESKPVADFPFKLTFGVPQSLKSILDHKVSPKTNVVIETAPTETTPTESFSSEFADSLISNGGFVADTPQQTVSQTDNSSQPVSNIDNIPHLPWPNPIPEAIMQYYGKNGKDWAMREKKYKDNIKKVMRITFNWEFLNSPEWKKMDENNQKSALEYLVDRYSSYVMVDGLQRLSDDPLVRDTIQERIDRVIITFDPTSKIKDGEDSSSKHYTVVLTDEKDLIVTVNLKEYDYYLYSFHEKKMDKVLNMRFAQCKRDWEKTKRKEAMNQLKAGMKKEVPVDIDFESFCNHPNFTNQERLEEITRITENIYQRLLPNVITNPEDCKSLSGICKADKIYLAAAQEKVERVLFRYDPENKVQDSAKGGENAKHYRVELIDGTIYFTVNLKNYDEYTYNSEIKYDFIFDLRVLQAKRDCLPKLKEIEGDFKRKCGKEIPIQVEFDSWSNHPNFRKLAAANVLDSNNNDLSNLTRVMARLWENHASNIINSESNSLFDLIKENKRLKEIFQHRCNLIVLTYDPESSYKSKFDYSNANLYRYDLSDEGTFTIIISLAEYDNYGYDVLKKLNPLWESNALIRDLESHLKSATDSISSVVGKEIPVFVDWSSYVKVDDFLIRPDQAAVYYYQIQKFLSEVPSATPNPNYLASSRFYSNNPKESLLKLLDDKELTHSTALSALVAAINRLCQSDVSQSYIKQKVEKIVITQKASVSEDRSITFANGILTFHFSMLGIASSKDINTYDWVTKIDWLLESTIPSLQKLALAQIERHRGDVKTPKIVRINNDKKPSEIQSPCPLEVNWNFLQNPTFLSQGPQHCIDEMNLLCNDIAHFYQSLGQISQHPVGAEFINNQLKKIDISYDPNSKDAKDDCLITFSSSTLQVSLSPKSLRKTLDSFMVDRLRFLFKLIVPEGFYDGKPIFTRVVDELKKLYAQPIFVECNTSITETDAFKALPYSDQYNVVLEMNSKLQERIIQTSLCYLLQHPTGIPKLCISKEIKGIRFDIEPDEGNLSWSKHADQNNILGHGETILLKNLNSSKNIANIGRLDKQDGIFIFTFPLHSFLLASRAVDWNERILDAFNLVVEIARKETDEHLGKSWSLMKTRIAKDVPLSYNFDELSAHNNFIQLTPNERTTIIKNAQTHLVDTLFLEDYGFTGPKGLCEFELSREVIRNKVDSFFVRIDASNSSRHNSFSLANKVLTATFNMNDTLAQVFSSCGPEVETVLELRPIKEKAVYQEVSERTTKLCGEHMNGDKRAFKFTIDWPSLANNPQFVATKDILEYVEIARIVGRDIHFFLCGKKTNSVFNLMEETALLQKNMHESVSEFFIQLGKETCQDLIVPTTSDNNSRYNISLAFSNIKSIIDVAHFTHLKEKSLDFFDLIVDTGIKERVTRLNAVSSQVSATIGNKINIEIPVEFAKTDKFLSYTPTQRYVMILCLFSELPEKLFIGDMGITGKLGLCEFQNAKEVVQKAIQQIQIHIVDTLAPPLITITNGLCVVSYSIEDLFAKKFYGLHHDFEDYLQLRPLKELSVKKEQDEKTTLVCGFPIPIQIDWESVIKPKDREYVQESRDVGALVRSIITEGGGRGFGDHTALTIAKAYTAEIKAYSLFLVTLVPKKIYHNPGNTKTLQPTSYETITKGDIFTLVISREHNLSWDGPGLTIEWALSPYNASEREKKEVKRLGSIWQNQEIARRNSEVQDHNNDVLNKQKDYKRDVERWQSDCKSTQKHNEEKCHFCKGTGRKPCGNCQGSKCRKCGGSKKVSCTWSNCPRAHSQKKMPNQPKEPRYPSPPTFRDLGTEVEEYTDEL